ncbi:D-sedoheptulose 7-phosphate isomerase [Desulfovibrio sp. OttesenSCG-928-F07]|nr:D-sedoheptulose 7-phosphate isomerase [Desulfovibrio sp. OttesenSCG-928-F07]
MPKQALDIIADYANDGQKLRDHFFAENADKVNEAAIIIATAIAKQGKLLLCGNGGSAADAQHVAGEFVNRFIIDRPPLPAIALSTDTSVLTAIGNDFGYDLVFYKQVQALGQSGDVLFAISTSGNSANVLKAIEAAREKEMTVIGLTGGKGGKMAELCDLLINVNHPSTPLVQEIHLAVEHLICLLCDHYLFENVQALKPYLA